MEQSAFLYMCEKAISFCIERCAIERFKQLVQLFDLIVPRLCPKSLKDFRIKLCALRSRSKKVFKTEAQKGWSTLAKESQDNWSARLYMIITVPSILSRISFLA